MKSFFKSKLIVVLSVLSVLLTPSLGKNEGSSFKSLTNSDSITFKDETIHLMDKGEGSGLITYVLNGGKINEEYKDSYSATPYILPVNVTKDHYVFDGWYLDSEFTSTRVYRIEVGETGNKTYYAKFIPQVYNIYYELNGGEFSANYPTNYTYSEGVTLPTTVTKDGYEFVGWSLVADSGDNLVKEISKDEYGDKTYYAIYKNTTNLWWLWLIVVVVIIAVVGLIAYYMIDSGRSDNVHIKCSCNIKTKDDKDKK